MARRKRRVTARAGRPVRRPVAIAGICALCLALYWPTRSYDFVWDDLSYHLAANQELMNGHHAFFWRHAYRDFYSPVTYSTWIWLKDVSQISRDGQSVLRPEAFRTAGLLLHAGNTALVWFLLLLLGGSSRGALLGASLFAVHPMQVESVVWISEYRGLLAAFFSFAALALYCRYRRDGTRPGLWLGAATAMFVLALLSKPSTVALPLIILAFDAVLPVTSEATSCGRVAVAWTLLALPMMLITKAVQPDAAVEFRTTLFVRPLIAADAINHYTLKLLVPFPLAASYGRTPELVARATSTYLLWLIPVAILFLVWIMRRRSPVPWMCTVIVAAAIVPVSGLVPFKGQNFSTVADRYFYVAMFGPALALTVFATRFERRRSFWVVMISLLAVLIWVNREQQRVWQDDLTLFGHATRWYPNQPRVHNNYGAALQWAGRQDEAIAQFDVAIKARPTFADAYCNRGNSFGRLKRFEEALRDQTRAIELDPTDGGCAYNRAVTEYSQGRFSEALADLQRATALGYRFPSEFEQAVRRKLGR